MSRFSLEVFQNEYLAEGATSMDAIVTVRASGSRLALDGQVAVILVVDTSASMNDPPSRIWAARLAAAEAVDNVRDGVRFAVVAGNERATVVYPPWGRDLAVADQATRHAAREAVRRLEAEGGTAMSAWLHAARQLFATASASVRHVILVTDGENREESGKLDEALAACAGIFQADCRGVGTAWMVSELRKIASALLGTVDIIPESEHMEAEFRALMDVAMRRGVGDVALRVWCPRDAAVSLVRQVSPQVEDLTGRPVQLDAFTRQYPLGAWGDEVRDYHVSIELPPNEVGVEMLAARLQLTVGGAVVGQGAIRVAWTDDELANGPPNPEVVHYVAQTELVASIQQGLEALKLGNHSTATARLGRATQIAATAGHDDALRLLDKVVQIEDERGGIVQLRADVDTADQMTLDTRSTHTIRPVRD
jgi:von Willebrand factor type A C-terminal domain/von Willebrand factor type A domain